MKAIFYNELFKIGWPIGARLVYAQYLFQDYVGIGENFNGEGWTFNAEQFREGLNYLDDDKPASYYLLCATPANKIASVLNVSRQSVSNNIKTLIACGAWQDGVIVVKKNIAESSYFYLESETGLSGWNLIVYSFLVHRCKKYKFVNTNRGKLAETFGITETHLSHIIAGLIKDGWVTKVMNGRYWKLIPQKKVSNA